MNLHFTLWAQQILVHTFVKQWKQNVSCSGWQKNNGRLKNRKTKVEEFQHDYPEQTESSCVVLDQWTCPSHSTYLDHYFGVAVFHPIRSRHLTRPGRRHTRRKSKRNKRFGISLNSFWQWRTKILWPGPEETRKRKEASTEIIGKNTSWSQSLQGFCTSKRRLALGFLNHQEYQTLKTTQGNQLHGWHQQQSGAFQKKNRFSSQKGVKSWKRLYGQRHFSPVSVRRLSTQKKIIKSLAFQMSKGVPHAFWKVWLYSLRMVFSPIIRLRKGIQESV